MVNSSNEMSASRLQGRAVSVSIFCFYEYGELTKTS